MIDDSLNMLKPFDYGICWRGPTRCSGGAVLIAGVGPAHPGPSALQAELSSSGAPGKVVRRDLVAASNTPKGTDQGDRNHGQLIRFRERAAA